MALYALPTDPILYITIGFLIAGAIVLGAVPFNWRDRLQKRAVERGLLHQAAAASSLMDILADRDRLRADFAMSKRQLELRLEALHNELGKKDGVIKRLKAEVKKKTAAIVEAEAGARLLRRQLRTGTPVRKSLRSRIPARARATARTATPRAAQARAH